MTDSLVVEMENRKLPYWVTYIRGRIAKNKNFLGFISGPTGSGKSWTGLSICSMVDPKFDSSRIVTSMRQLMHLINSGSLRSGSAILWDEAGVDINARNWQSLTNKLINYLLQTFRHKQFVLIFTSPHLDFVDASTRKLFHAEFSTMSIDYEEKTTKIKPHLIQYNSRSKKFYYKYLRVRLQFRGVVPVKVWNVPKPNNRLIEEYEGIKNQFTTDLNKDIERQLDEIEAEKQPKDARRPLTELQEKVLSLMGELNDVKKVSDRLGLTSRNVYFHIERAKAKGWTIEEIKSKKEHFALEKHENRAVIQ